jgi:hypothetical protein
MLFEFEGLNFNQTKQAEGEVAVLCPAKREDTNSFRHFSLFQQRYLRRESPMITLMPSRWIAAVCIALLPIAATGHHSFASNFDVHTMNELEGEISNLRWKNPHIVFTLKTSNAEGEEVLYQIESHSLAIMRRNGIPADALHDGDRVKIAGHPGRHVANAMFVQHVLMPNGDELVLHPKFEPRWAESVAANSTWQATHDDAENEETGIFRVWSTSLRDVDEGLAYPETLNPAAALDYPLTPEARAVLMAFDPLTDALTVNCHPKGMPAIMENPFPIEFVEGEGAIELHLEEYDTLRTIYMDVANEDMDHTPSLVGYSVGRWEGTTLVVETDAMNYGHFDSVGIPLSDSAKVTERYIPSDDGKRLGFEMTVVDSATFTEPVILTKTWLGLPDAKVQPYDCTE